MTIPPRFARYSKMTPGLEAKLREQIKLRRNVRSLHHDDWRNSHER